MAPNCRKYEETLDATRKLLAPERNADVVLWLTNYLGGLGGTYSGGAFDREVDHGHPNEFTQKDFDAVARLKVHVVKSAQLWLSGEGKAEANHLLEDIPQDVDIWNVAEDHYAKVLGEDSPAWQLWKLLEGLQQEGQARRAGTGVTAGKLLHGKRPRLIPIFDREVVEPELHVTDRNVWEAFWCTLRNVDIRERLNEIRESVPEAAHLSTLRVLDIIVWMSVKAGSGRGSSN